MRLIGRTCSLAFEQPPLPIVAATGPAAGSSPKCNLAGLRALLPPRSATSERDNRRPAVSSPLTAKVGKVRIADVHRHARTSCVLDRRACHSANLAKSPTHRAVY